MESAGVGGWWQASDGNWYPPQAAEDVEVDGPASASKQRRNWKKIGAVVGAIVVVTGLGVATWSFRSASDRWQQREHEQHARADRLDHDLANTKDDLSSTQGQLDSAQVDLTAAQSWSKEADAALKAYAQCVNDTDALLRRADEDVVTGKADPGLQSEAVRVGRECDLAIAHGMDIASPPTATS